MAHKSRRVSGKPIRLGSATLSTVLAACVGAVLIGCVSLLVYGSGRGFDLTDEVFYLIWARDPRAYALTYQPFGYLLHPLFALVDGRLQTYRLVGFLVTGLAGGFLGQALAPAARWRSVCALQGALAALTIYFPWIITPSYNSAANVGAILIVGGLIAMTERSAASLIAAVMAISFGLCLSAFSKPPLFAISVGVVLGTMIAANNARIAVALFAALALGAAAIFLFIAPSELVTLVPRMLLSQRVLSLPNSPLGLPGKIINEWRDVPVALKVAAAAVVAGGALNRFRWSTWTGYAAVALALYYFANCTPDVIDGELPDFLGLSVILLAAGYGIAIREDAELSWQHFALLIGTPFAVALGTFNNLWSQLSFSMACPFITLFALACGDHVFWRKTIALLLGVVGPAAILLLAAEYPYSLPASIFDQEIPVTPPLVKGRILVDEETADFMVSANGLGVGKTLIDLSGTGPGVGTVLGARLPVLPWLNPATASWPDVVWTRLSLQERRRAVFVVPVLPAFRSTAAAKWLQSHQGGYCRTALASMTFWGDEKRLELWSPWRRGTSRSSRCRGQRASER